MVLWKSRRSSMARSVEARLPFLTTRLASFALSLPAEHLIGPDGTGKSVLRAALKGLVPDAVLQRREKVGFAVPNRTWITLVPGTADLLDEAGKIPAVERRPVEEISRALREGRPLSEGTAALAWRLAVLVLWVRRFGAEIP